MPAYHATSTQIGRLLALQDWARAGRTFTAPDVMRAFNVSRSTFMRDIAVLRDVWHLPLVWDTARGSYVLDGPAAPIAPLSITGHELAAFLVARHALDALGDGATAEVLASVVDRLALTLPPSVRVSSEALAVRFAPSGPHTGTHPAWHGALVAAIEATCLVRLSYRSASKDEATERDVEPALVVQTGNRWYLVGYCRLREGWRDFRLDRIEALATPGDTFSPRPFDRDVYLGQSLGMHRGDETYPVHVRFSARQSRWLREERYHDTQQNTPLPDGRLDVRMQVGGLPDLVRWLLAYGPEVEVLGPAMLRHAVANAHRAAAALYTATTASDA